jgi:transglutaminase-like putative cysteine protease
MSKDNLFRLSTYWCLILSTACLGLAASRELPEAIPLFSLIGLILAAEYFNRERWLLPNWASNLLAVVIVVLWAGWFFLGTSASGEDLLGELLPRSAPLLGVLLVAKLLRPKQTADYWMLHLLGLVQVVLASVLALQTRMDRSNPLFVCLLAAYTFSAIWATLHLARHGEWERNAPKGGTRAQEQATPWTLDLPAKRDWEATWQLGAALRWTFLGLVLGLFLFFAVPRPGQDLSGTLLLPGSARAQTGFSPGLDLNETTPIEVSEDEVMRVEVTDAYGRRVMLDCDNQRWRGVVCSVYQRGRWAPVRAGEAAVLSPREEQSLQPGQLHLSFFLDLTRIQGGWYAGDATRGLEFLERPANQPIFLAEPVISEGQNLPSLTLENVRDRSSTLVTYRNRDMTASVPTARRARRLAYSQVWTWLPREDGFSPLVSFQLQQPGQREYWDSLLALPLPAEDLNILTSRTQELLRSANLDPTLDERRLSGQQRQERRVAIARALTQRLSQSNEYAYSLERPRKDMERDPTVDFLVNTKEGHCGLYASALALMLRTQGIPSRVVIGFRGARWYSVGEYHAVCQFHAHAWVEAFITDADAPAIPPRPSPGTLVGRDNRAAAWPPITGRWLTLDPTPGGGTAAVAGYSVADLWRDFTHFLSYLWEFFILEYSGDVQQARVWSRLQRAFDLREWAALWDTLRTLFAREMWFRLVVLAFAALLLGWVGWRGWLIWRRLGRRRVLPHVPGFYGSFLAILARAGLKPRAGQTPGEFAQEAAVWLQRSPATSAVQAVPQRLVEHYYAIRFGAATLTPEQSRQIRDDLGRLRQALAVRRP